MFVLFAMLKQGGWTVSNHRNLISVTVYNELKCIGVVFRYISPCSNTTYGLDIYRRWNTSENGGAECEKWAERSEGGESFYN